MTGVRARGRAYVGVSGWRYPRWRGDFYPKGLPQRLELTYASERMSSVEINSSFYSLQRPSSYAAWRDGVPADFVFAVKGGRFITHLKRLKDVQTPLANFFGSGVLALGPALGPVLWQLPEGVVFDTDVLDSFLRLLPHTTDEAAELARQHDDKLPDDRALTTALVSAPLRHALEPRHESFTTPAARDVLRRHRVALVIADTAGRWPVMGLPDDPTADFHYLRLHGEERLYGGGYSEKSLDRWAAVVRSGVAAGQDVHVYFDNDADGRAPHDAVALLGRVTS